MNKIFASIKQKIDSNLSNLIGLEILKETRTRILMMYVLLMVLFLATAIPAIRARVYYRVSNRVRLDLEDELEDFEELFVERLLQPDNRQADDGDRNTINKQKIYAVLDEFFQTEIPEDDNFLVSIVDGEFYKSSSIALPEAIQPGSTLMNRLQNITEEEFGEVKLNDPEIGNLLYDAEPIKTTDSTLGVIVAVHTTAGEQEEAVEALDAIIEVLIVIIAIALAIAWLGMGKILSPLNELTKITKTINEANLSYRVDVKGNGELAELGNTFNQMMNRIQVSFDTQRNFINDAGHELRTPITIIRGHMELMDLNDDPEANQETVDLVIDELDRMNRLVEDLIILTKAERPDFLKVEPIDVASLIDELFIKAQGLGDRQWQLENNANGTIIGDRQRLSQAILNLANNAVQHTPIGDTITLGCISNEYKIEIWLRDTGDGIAASEQQRIFERFARVKNARRCSDGSGLGLSIVKAIVEAHGGFINLRSCLGVGSTFSLVFPLKSNQKLLVNEANTNR
ncbi:MAG: HAMP domain-containing sensor histidine kinase [Cyanobacteria bacterium P01_G01_bin.19]